MAPRTWRNYHRQRVEISVGRVPSYDKFAKQNVKKMSIGRPFYDDPKFAKQESEGRFCAGRDLHDNSWQIMARRHGCLDFLVLWIRFSGFARLPMKLRRSLRQCGSADRQMDMAAIGCMTVRTSSCTARRVKLARCSASP
jgi:hypothetical protein